MSAPGPDDEPESDPPEPSGPGEATGSLPFALLFVAGGAALIFIGYVWGRGSLLESAFALSLVVVGAAGILAGGLRLYRALRER
jgi:hypothetical protein